MKIRTRLTLWYAGILFAALLLITGSTYYEMFVEHRPPGKELIQLPEGESALEEFGEILLYGGLPAILLALVGGSFLMRRALLPVTRLTQAIERIHTGNLHERLACSKSGDELDRLTQVFNDMTGRLNDSFRRIREFTLHASHELKTPLTIMHASLETAWKEEALTPAQRDRLGSQLEEVRRLSRIVDELTLLTKADAGLVTLARAPVRLDELLRETFEDVQILAQSRAIEARLLACEEVIVAGDRNRLRQLLLNLSDNAIKYNHQGGQVTLALRRQDKLAEFAVTNTGPVLAPEFQSRVFDRFFRGDLSHSNEVEGCGLGLSIALCIAQLHGGTIEFAQRNQETVVTVRLPSTPVSRPREAGQLSPTVAGRTG